jgi:hypothetical protein
MIQRYTPSKLVDYSWDPQTCNAQLAFGEECEPGEAAEYQMQHQTLKTPEGYDELRASYFDNLKRWIRAEKGGRA